MRRLAPRPLVSALGALAHTLAPATTLARVQGVWDGAAGPAVAAETEPASERDGVVTVSCSSAVWAQELTLLEGEIRGRLNAALGDSATPPAVRALRFVAARPKPRRR